MRIIDPGNLAADYGSSVEIQSATLQITDASASKSIASLLPWVKDLNPRDLYRDPPMKIDAEIINRYYFERSG